MKMLLVAFLLTAVTVLIHGLGSIGSATRIRHLGQQWQGQLGFLHLSLLMIYLVSLLLVLHLVEVGVWAAYYRGSSLLPDFETAAYYSLTSYTTVGYGDVVLREHWRILGPIESAVGVLMLGWSTGIIVAVLTRIYQKTEFHSPPNPGKQ